MRTARRRQRELEYAQPFDAAHRPPLQEALMVNLARLEEARDVSLYGSREAYVQAYSHYADPTPHPLAVQLQGLYDQQQAINEAVEMRDVEPFPGVRLGPGPGFHSAPNTNPVIAPPTGRVR